MKEIIDTIITISSIANITTHTLLIKQLGADEWVKWINRFKN